MTRLAFLAAASEKRKAGQATASIGSAGLGCKPQVASAIMPGSLSSRFHATPLRWIFSISARSGPFLIFLQNARLQAHGELAQRMHMPRMACVRCWGNPDGMIPFDIIKVDDGRAFPQSEQHQFFQLHRKGL